MVYDTDLMMVGGRITGSFIREEDLSGMHEALTRLFGKAEAKYGAGNVIFQAMGDGNHSLATAKTAWENLKKTLTPEEIEIHPARYALCEIENIHDDGIVFEPIHRMLFAACGQSGMDIVEEAVELLKSQNGNAFIAGEDAAVPDGAFAIPFISGTRKLGEEGGPRLYYDSKLDEAGFMLKYLEEYLFIKLLNTVALQNKLELNDTKILYIMYKLDRECIIDELTALTGTTSTACTVALTKLIALGYVKIASINLFGENKVSYRYVNGRLDELLDKVTSDFAAVSFAGISDEECESYIETAKKIMDNLKKTTVVGEE